MQDVKISFDANILILPSDNVTVFSVKVFVSVNLNFIPFSLIETADILVASV